MIKPSKATKTSQNKNLEICLFYQTDPFTIVPGGIDSFIKGIIKYAPDDIEIRMVGVTTNKKERPVGRWKRLSIDQRKLFFFPVLFEPNLGRQHLIPLSIRFTFALLKYPSFRKFDVIEFHRIEPFLPFYFSNIPANLVVHQDMKVIEGKKSDIRWKYFPKLFYFIEQILIKKIKSIYCVRKNAVEQYREKFSKDRDKFNFIPTWVDTSIFKPLTKKKRLDQKAKFCKIHGFNYTDRLIITVGRLDHQKDPLFLLNCFTVLNQKKPNVRLLFIGDGILKKELSKRIKEYSLQKSVKLLGLRSPIEIADLLNIADVFALTSVYEGMPICVLESLATGLPVVSTNVGEISRVITSNHVGRIVENREKHTFVDALIECINLKNPTNEMLCIKAIQNFVPEEILKSYYQNYRQIAPI